MADDELFAREEATITIAGQLLSDGRFAAPEDREAYAALLKDYQKLFRTTRRLMRLSDRNERELSAVSEKQRLAAEEISRKNKELETLSSKLSKYLSPQVYQSIFTGAQTVEISSKRKKLTIFFSDIAGFTETTDNLESEELTDVLNQYLTEMSAIALSYGATIDKYIGDAMLLFFGDPESKGVKKDAKSCVMMAIAMQRRMRDLEQEWRNRGLERPFRIRMGISTGFCTVGNFGSRDRMEYTIIGNEVNLAARLQYAAEPGGVLLSHETNALVQDIVLTEEYPPMTVKGFLRPIKTYKLLGTYKELVDEGRVVLQEREGLRVLVDLTKQVSSEAIEVLEEVLAELKRRSDLYTNLKEGAAPIRSELPHMRLDADPELMSPEERAQAAGALRDALARIEAALPRSRPRRQKATSRALASA